MKQPTGALMVDLRSFLQENIEQLQGIVRTYVLRAGLAHGEDVQNVMIEVLNEATLEALAHEDAFRAVQQPRAWFLGIVANIIKRRRSLLFKRNQHESVLSDLVLEDEQGSEFFDRISQISQPGPEQEIEVQAEVTELLTLASPEDRRVLRLAFLQDLDTRSLALALGVSESNARVRLHRALQRLRLSWQVHRQQQERGHHA